jgi:hypothetical protein
MIKDFALVELMSDGVRRVTRAEDEERLEQLPAVAKSIAEQTVAAVGQLAAWLNLPAAYTLVLSVIM